MRSFATGVAVGAGAMILVIGGLALGLGARALPVRLQMSSHTLARTVVPASAPLVPPLVAAVEQNLAAQIQVSVRLDGTRVRLPAHTVHQLADSLRPTLTAAIEKDLRNRRFVDSVLMPLLLRDLRAAAAARRTSIVVPVRVWPGFTIRVPVSLTPPSS